MEREDASQGTERGDSSQRHDPEGDRQRRLEALRGLADHSGGPDGAPATKTAANPRSRRWIALTALLVVALLAGGLVTHLRAPSAPTRQTSAPPPPTLLRINPGLDGYNCPTHLAWSPDGARVAVLASRSGTCDNTHVAGLIYDTHTGKRLTTLAADDILASEHLVGFPLDLTWTPDGKSVAFSVIAADASQGAQAVAFSALLVMSVAGGQVRLLRGTPAPTFSAVYNGVIWDLQAGKEVTLIQKHLPAALDYRWGEDGQIAASQPLPPAAPGQLTGSPHSGTDGTFSRWQAGTLTPIDRLESQHPDITQPPLAEGYIASANLWSPDGRYLALNAQTQALLLLATGRAPASLSRDACSFAGFVPDGCPAAPAPYPDQALAAIEAAAEASTHFHGPNNASGMFWVTVPLAWRADGQRLAVILPDDGFDSGTTKVAISIFHTDATTPAARLTADVPGPYSNNPRPGMPGLAWSPTGQQIALLDSQDGLLYLFGGDQLRS